MRLIHRRKRKVSSKHSVWLLLLFTLLLFPGIRSVGQVLPGIEAMVKEANGYRNSDPDKAMLLARKALEEARKEKHDLSTARVMRFIGVLSFMKGDLQLAEAQFDSAYKTYSVLNDKAGIAASLNNLGVVHQEKSNYTKAIEFFERSVTMKLELGDSTGAMSGMVNTGTIYS